MMFSRNSKSVKHRYLLALGLWAAFMATPGNAQELTDFRQPTDIEKAYVALASAMKDASICAKISPMALHRVRKPILTRTRCYYYLALNTQDTRWCRDAREIPASAGMMSWLDPVESLGKTPRKYPVAFDAKGFLKTLGYDPSKDRYKDLINPDNHKLHAEFRNRLAKLPDFTAKEDSSATQNLAITQREAEIEAGIVVNKALRLCAAGRGDSNCNDQIYSMMRNENLRKAGFDIPDPKTNYRPPTGIEAAYFEVAQSQNISSACSKISDSALTIGWSRDPGRVFAPLKSMCYLTLAESQKDASLCEHVKSIDQAGLDGAGITDNYCRSVVAGNERTIPAGNLQPDWQDFLKSLGYTETDIFKTLDASNTNPRSPDPTQWAFLSRHLMNPLKPGNKDFLSRVKATPNASDSHVSGQEFYTESQLHKHFYQFSLTRFHCRLSWEEVDQSGKQTPYRIGDYAAFSMIDHTGRSVTEADYTGKYLLAYFGYTYCPDVCPTSLMTIAGALESLNPKDKALVVPTFFTLDSKRDTYDLLGPYVEMFHPDFVGLTGTTEQIRQAAQGLNVYYFAGDIKGKYVVEHTAYYYLIGPDSKPITFFEHSITPDELATRVQSIIAEDRKKRSQDHASLIP